MCVARKKSIIHGSFQNSISRYRRNRFSAKFVSVSIQIMALLSYANEIDNDKLMAAGNTGTLVIYAKGDSSESWGRI